MLADLIFMTAHAQACKLDGQIVSQEISFNSFHFCGSEILSEFAINLE